MHFDTERLSSVKFIKAILSPLYGIIKLDVPPVVGLLINVVLAIIPLFIVNEVVEYFKNPFATIDSFEISGKLQSNLLTMHKSNTRYSGEFSVFLCAPGRGMAIVAEGVFGKNEKEVEFKIDIENKFTYSNYYIFITHVLQNEEISSIIDYWDYNSDSKISKQFLVGEITCDIARQRGRQNGS